MRRGRIFFYLAFIIILGLVAVVVVYNRLIVQPPAANPGAVQPTPSLDLVNVVILTQTAKRGSIIEANMLQLVPVARQLYIDGMFTDIGEAAGRRAKFDLDAGLTLTRGMLVDAPEQLSTTGSLAALSIPRGMVAVSVPISRLSSVSYAPQAGDHVNVIVTLMFVDLDTEFQTALPDRNTGIVGPGSGQANLTGSAGASVGTERDPVKQEATGGTQAQIQASSLVAVSGGGGGVIGRVFTDPQLNETFYIIPGEQRQRPRIVSQNLLQDIIVLNVGNFPYAQQPTLQPTPAPEAQPPAEGGVQQQPAQAAQPPDVITLIVSPQDAITLNYLLFSGAQLTMALRSANDDTRVQTDPVTLQFLLSTYNIAIPAKLPNGMEPAPTELKLPALRNDAIPTPAP